MGITFAVYGHEAGTEKVWPFDIVPRIVDATEWNKIDRGLKQRILALNMFVADVDGEQWILKELVQNNFPYFVVQTPWSGRVPSRSSSIISSGPRGPDYVTANREVVLNQFLSHPAHPLRNPE